MVHINSINAYHSSDKAKRQKITELILNEVKLSNGITRQELSQRLNIPINSVCGCVHGLINSGKIISKGSTINPNSGMPCSLLSPA